MPARSGSAAWAAGISVPTPRTFLSCVTSATRPGAGRPPRGYLETLLANRERVLAATDLDDWAAAEATPSEEEITRLRVLIRRTEEAVDGLGPAEQTALLEATTALRTVRQVHLGMPGIAPPQQDSRLERDT